MRARLWDDLLCQCGLLVRGQLSHQVIIVSAQHIIILLVRD